MEIYLRRRHVLVVTNGAFSHKIDNASVFWEILNLEGHLNRFMGSKVTPILVNGGFYLVLELHQEGCAPVIE